MRVFLIAERIDARRLAAAVRAAGLDPEPIAAPSGLAEALIALESRLSDRGIGVVLGDDSDLSLAAALVAAKRGLALAATPPALHPASRNGRVLAQLADARLGGEPAELTSWARSAIAGARSRSRR